jgi:catechol 2,3-dioxygenase-like lactoylglutathione lyase family enzyme
MPVSLNHTIVWCRDKHVSSRFLTEMLGLPPAEPFMHFMVVRAANGVSLDYSDFVDEADISLQHYAFLVSEAEFDEIHRRIVLRGLDHWADPARTRPGEINHHFGGRGVYFCDPDGHLLEVITQPYAAG